jgi:hypothetical protein
MTRRRLLCGLLLASALLACFGGWLWVASGSRVSLVRFERVKKGMSREEVIRTVGGPPGDYSAERGGPFCKGLLPEHERWICDDGELFVRFDEDDTAAHLEVFDALRPTPTLSVRIRRWLGL